MTLSKLTAAANHPQAATATKAPAARRAAASAARKAASPQRPPPARPAPAKAPAATAAARASAPATTPTSASKAPVAKATKADKATPSVKEPKKAERTDKARKPKLVRDSFTIPKAEYAVLDALKQRAARAGRPAKKSELLRAGIKALAAMSDAAFTACLDAVPAIKTGRPAKG